MNKSDSTISRNVSILSKGIYKILWKRPTSDLDLKSTLELEKQRTKTIKKLVMLIQDFVNCTRGRL